MEKQLKTNTKSHLAVIIVVIVGDPLQRGLDANMRSC